MVKLTKVNTADSDLLRESELNELNSKPLDEDIEDSEIIRDLDFKNEVIEAVKSESSKG